MLTVFGSEERGGRSRMEVKNGHILNMKISFCDGFWLLEGITNFLLPVFGELELKESQHLFHCHYSKLVS